MSSQYITSQRRSIAETVYQEVLANQQRTQELSTRGLEAAIYENEQLHYQLIKMEAEMTALRARNALLEQRLGDHMQICPIFK